MGQVNQKVQDEINEFLAESVLTMDNETRNAWDKLSDSERKLVAATAFFFKQGYNQAQRSKMVEQMCLENRCA